MLVCLFFRVLRPTREFFILKQTSLLPVKGCKCWPYARHLGPFSSEFSLAFHTYCDKGRSFIIIISEDPWHSHLLTSVWQWSCHWLFLRLKGCRGGDSNTQLSTWEAIDLTDCITAAVKQSDQHENMTETLTLHWIIFNLIYFCDEW